MSGSAFSAPSARAGRESVTRFIKRMCAGFKIVKPKSVATNILITSLRLEERRN